MFVDFDGALKARVSRGCGVVGYCSGRSPRFFTDVR